MSDDTDSGLEDLLAMFEDAKDQIEAQRVSVYALVAWSTAAGLFCWGVIFFALWAFGVEVEEAARLACAPLVLLVAYSVVKGLVYNASKAMAGPIFTAYANWVRDNR